MNLLPFFKTFIALELPKGKAVFQMWPTQCSQKGMIMSFNILAAVFWGGLFHCRYRTLHSSLLNILSLISAHSWSLSLSEWLFCAPSLELSSNMIRGHCISSRLKILNRLKILKRLRADPCGTLWTVQISHHTINHYMFWQLTFSSIW